jgi:hypothetical protein
MVERHDPNSLREKRLYYLTMLAPAMPGRVHVECVREILALAKHAGLDEKKLYETAVNARPKEWKPAPPFKEVKPTPNDVKKYGRIYDEAVRMSAKNSSDSTTSRSANPPKSSKQVDNELAPLLYEEEVVGPPKAPPKPASKSSKSVDPDELRRMGAELSRRMNAGYGLDGDDSPPASKPPASPVTLDEINANPLNQEAKRWLKLAKEPLEEDHQYLLQLMMWGLESGKVYVEDPQVYSFLVQRLGDLLRYKDQARVLEYLQENLAEPDDPLLDLEVLSKSLTPKRAAIYLLNQLDERLQQEDPLQRKYHAQHPKSPG